jgi:hypothetical protein
MLRGVSVAHALAGWAKKWGQPCSRAEKPLVFVQARGLSPLRWRTRQRARHVLIGLVLCAALANAAILPDQIGDFTKGSSKALALQDQALYEEYCDRVAAPRSHWGAGAV